MSSGQLISLFAPEALIEDGSSTIIFKSIAPALLKSSAATASELLGEESIAIVTHGKETDLQIPGRHVVAKLDVPNDIAPTLLDTYQLDCLAILNLADLFEWEEFWYIHHDVQFVGDWGYFFREFQNVVADFLAPCLRSRVEDAKSEVWNSFSLSAEKGDLQEASQLAGSLAIFRMSRAGFEAAKSAASDGWGGLCDVIFPTAVREAGLIVEDIGSHGSLTPDSRRGRFYSPSSFNGTLATGHVEGFLHYPVCVPLMHPSRCRYYPSDAELPKVLYFSAVGSASGSLLESTIEEFRRVEATVLLVEYEAPGVVYPRGCEVRRDTGQKWELVRRHLNPFEICDFDYVFVWDDDIAISDFDVSRFIRIMRSNFLDVAQPSIVSSHDVCHDITRQKPCPSPLGRLLRVGRLTNFVEIMVPVFTRDSWAEFYSYLSAQSRFGWGMDSLLLGKKGIVDCMHVEHTRPCSPYGPEARFEMRAFLDSQGLIEISHQELGYLFDSC